MYINNKKTSTWYQWYKYGCIYLNHHCFPSFVFILCLCTGRLCIYSQATPLVFCFSFPTLRLSTCKYVVTSILAFFSVSFALSTYLHFPSLEKTVIMEVKPRSPIISLLECISTERHWGDRKVQTKEKNPPPLLSMFFINLLQQGRKFEQKNVKINWEKN